MFLTITIDTQKKQKLKMNRSKICPKKGWRKAFNMKKRSFWQKIVTLRRSMKKHSYKLNDQTVMF
ncbi:hypothetical protein KJ632_00130 [Patescibacteria group bacterium]|nr:hypothetical protein [Patescibacteria group bacterium]